MVFAQPFHFAVNSRDYLRNDKFGEEERKTLNANVLLCVKQSTL